MVHDAPDTDDARPSRWSADVRLVERVRRGERAATEELVARLGCVRRFLGARNAALGRPLSAEELEDTVQSTLLALWTKLPAFAGTGSLEAWAYRFSYLEFLNRLQMLRRRPRSLEDLERAPELEPVHGHDPFEHERLYLALERLDARAAEVLRLRNLDDLSFEEIAARERSPVNTVKTRYYRALERLRGLLGASRDASLVREEP